MAEELTETAQPKHPGGRPTDYKPEYVEQVEKLCRLGATDKYIACFFNICEATLNNWKKEYPEFLESMRNGKDFFDTEMVEKSLLSRALGYEHAEDKIFQYEGQAVIVPTTKHYPPDPASMIFWLKNRNPARWRDRTEMDLNVNESDARRKLAEQIKANGTPPIMAAIADQADDD